MSSMDANAPAAAAEPTATLLRPPPASCPALPTLSRSELAEFAAWPRSSRLWDALLIVDDVLPRLASMSIVTSATFHTSHRLVEASDRVQHLHRRLTVSSAIRNQEVRQLELPALLAPVAIRYCCRNGGRLDVPSTRTEWTANVLVSDPLGKLGGTQPGVQVCHRHPEVCC